MAVKYAQRDAPGATERRREAKREHAFAPLFGIERMTTTLQQAGEAHHADQTPIGTRSTTGKRTGCKSAAPPGCRSA
jgi:hypothetical protein